MCIMSIAIRPCFSFVPGVLLLERSMLHICIIRTRALLSKRSMFPIGKMSITVKEKHASNAHQSIPTKEDHVSHMYHEHCYQRKPCFSLAPGVMRFPFVPGVLTLNNSMFLMRIMTIAIKEDHVSQSCQGYCYQRKPCFSLAPGVMLVPIRTRSIDIKQQHVSHAYHDHCYKRRACFSIVPEVLLLKKSRFFMRIMTIAIKEEQVSRKIYMLIVV